MTSEIVQPQERNNWFHGIEGLIRRPDGYVSWKGTVIEHYTFNDKEEERNAAHQLATRCRMLEEKNFPICTRTALGSTLFQDAPAGTPWLDAMLRYYAIFTDTSGTAKSAIFYMPNGAAVAASMENDALKIRYGYEDDGAFGTYRLYHELQREGFTSCTDRIATYDSFVSAMNEIGITPEHVRQILGAPVPERDSNAEDTYAMK